MNQWCMQLPSHVPCDKSTIGPRLFHSLDLVPPTTQVTTIRAEPALNRISRFLVNHHRGRARAPDNGVVKCRVRASLFFLSDYGKIFFIEYAEDANAAFLQRGGEEGRVGSDFAAF